QPGEPEGAPRSEYLQRADRPDGDDGALDRVVVLSQALLDRVAEHDKQDQVERLQRRQLAPPDHARQQIDEQEERDASERDVHYGKIVMSRENVSRRSVPSLSQTVCFRPRAMLVGLTWNCMKRMK